MNQMLRQVFKAGIAMVFLGNILFLNGCKSERPDPDVTVRLKSLGGGYKGIKWGSSKDEVIKAFGIKPRHDFGDKEEWELDFETESERIDCTFSRGKFYSVRVIFKVQPSDSPRPEITNAVLKDLIKQYGRVAPGRRESRYIWNDGETEIKYDVDNETYRIGCKSGVGPAVYYDAVNKPIIGTVGPIIISKEPKRIVYPVSGADKTNKRLKNLIERRK